MSKNYIILILIILWLITLAGLWYSYNKSIAVFPCDVWVTVKPKI